MGERPQLGGSAWSPRWPTLMPLQEMQVREALVREAPSLGALMLRVLMLRVLMLRALVPRALVLGLRCSWRLVPVHNWEH